MISSRSLSATAEVSDWRGIADSGVVRELMSWRVQRHHIGSVTYTQELRLRAFLKMWQDIATVDLRRSAKVGS